MDVWINNPKIVSFQKCFETFGLELHYYSAISYSGSLHEKGIFNPGVNVLTVSLDLRAH